MNLASSFCLRHRGLDFLIDDQILSHFGLHQDDIREILPAFPAEMRKVGALLNSG
jgi:hypothetical protein